MPAFMLGDRYALHFAGWKHHVGLYPVAPLDPELEAEVAPYRAAKDTVKLLYRDPLPTDLIERIAPRCATGTRSFERARTAWIRSPRAATPLHGCETRECP